MNLISVLYTKVTTFRTGFMSYKQTGLFRFSFGLSTYIWVGCIRCYLLGIYLGRMSLGQFDKARKEIFIQDCLLKFLNTHYIFLRTVLNYTYWKFGGGGGGGGGWGGRMER